MKKQLYIIPQTFTTDTTMNSDILIISNENYAGGVSTKDRGELDEEEEATTSEELQKYSLW